MKQDPLAISVDDPDEIFDLVDLHDHVIGRVRRGDAHRDPSLVHRSVQVVVFDSSGRLLLQRRSAAKDLFPGYYCASASGHVVSGEDYVDTAIRETEEELGQALVLAYVGTELVRSPYETEMTALFLGRADGPFSFNPSETDGGDFFDLSTLEPGLADAGATAIPMTPSLVAALNTIVRLREGSVLDLVLAEL